MDNYNYPMGADNSEAPWNQSDPEPVEVEVCISQTLSRVETIEVTDYKADIYEDVDIDVDGPCISRGVSYDFSDCDLAGAYIEQSCTIPKLLEYLKSYLIKDIADNRDKIIKKRLQHILKCCEGWEVDEIEVIEN